MFGGVPGLPSVRGRKVAVTSVIEPTGKAVIFMNYNRLDIQQGKLNPTSPSTISDNLDVGYRLVRPDQPADELSVWEA